MAGKESLHLNGLQSRAGHSREKRPLVVWGGGTFQMEKTASARAQRKQRARPTKLGSSGESQIGRSLRGWKNLNCAQCVEESFKSFFEQGNVDFGTFCYFCFVVAESH